MTAWWIRCIRTLRRRTVRRRWIDLLDRSVVLADLLDRFTAQVQLVGRDYLLLSASPDRHEVQAMRTRALSAAVAKLDQAVQVLKREMSAGTDDARDRHRRP